MNVRLLAATVALADAMAVLHARSFSESWSASALADLLVGPGVFGFLAVNADADEAFGFGLARVAADEAEILTLAVLPENRRSGVARAILHALLASAQQSSACAAFLEVAVDNVAALALYANIGFEITGRRSGYYARPTGAIDALIMRVALHPVGRGP